MSWRYGKKELPICAKEIKGHQLIFSGGGYFRLLPYWMIKRFTKDSKEYLLSYIHPRDLDAGQPMIAGLPWERRFKSYVGLKGAEQKLRKWLRDFDFIDISEANNLIYWENVPKIQL